uniref:MSP domain-containing protein n=1 Tax=Plectus sambesii TaxID=2011161 RepID=A0A914W9Y0_9BILA
MAFSNPVKITVVNRSDQQFNVLVNGTCEMLIKTKDEVKVFECTMGGSVVYKIEIVPFIGKPASIQIPKRYNEPMVIEVFGEAEKDIKLNIS